MPLFDSTYGQLRWTDVWTVLSADTSENELLDYKEYRGFKAFKASSRLERTIAAMANTHGGDIVIGIPEKDDGRPDRDGGVAGIPARDVRRVQNSIEERNWSIRPPVAGLSVESVLIPRGHRKPSSDGVRLVVVRVPRSDAAPHFLPGLGHYGRAGSHNGKFDETPLSTEWFGRLLQRREQSRMLLQEILRFVDGLATVPVWHKVWCAPRYPWHALWTDVDGRSLEEACPRIAWAASNDAALPHRLSLPFEYHFDGEIASRSVQHGWIWQLWEATVIPARGVDHTPFCTYMVDERGVVTMKALRRAEAMYSVQGRRSHADRRVYVPAFDWAFVTTGLFAVVRHACTLYRRHGYVGEVEFGVEVGVDRRHFGGSCLLATGVLPGESSTGEPSDSLQSLAGNEALKMSAPSGVVAETDSALVRDLPDAVLNSPLHRRWVRAFGYTPTQQEVFALLARLVSLID